MKRNKKTKKMKLITGAALCSLLLFTGTAAVNAAPVNQICSVQGCDITTNHDHDGISYCGHYYGDGHDYHEYCNISGCDQYGAHTHDSRSYIGCHSREVSETGAYSRGHHSGGCHRGRRR